MSQKIKPSIELRRMNRNRRNLEKHFKKQEEREKKKAEVYELSQKGKTGMQIINEFLNKAING